MGAAAKCQALTAATVTMTKTNVVAIRFYGFIVPDFGTYLFEIHHGDERLTQVPFWVVPLDQAPAAPV